MLKENLSAKVSFKDIFEDYVKLMNDKIEHGILSEEIGFIEAEKPLVPESYRILGIDKVRELKHHVGNIKTELVKLSDNPKAQKIRELIAERIGFGIFTDNVVKKRIQHIYNDLGIKKTAKSTSINNYFDTKDCIRKGKRCKEIIREKIVYDN